VTLVTDWNTAACLGHGELFILDENYTNEQVEAAKDICETCPIFDDCEAWAIKYREEFDIWAGKTPRERGSVSHADSVSVRHGTQAGHAWHKRYEVPMCRACRVAYNEAAKIRQRIYVAKKKGQPEGSGDTGDTGGHSLPLTKGDPRG
jgi:WhiB family redox-sensing transcriptional regulator